MDNPHIDLLAVLIAAIVNMIISYAWYSRPLFGKAWMHLSRLDASKMKMGKLTLVWAFFLAFATAYILGFFETYLGVTTVSDGMFVGFLAWLGFVATTLLSGVIWGQNPFKVFLINAGCKLLTFIVMGGIIGA